jgi:hypothetical protein
LREAVEIHLLVVDRIGRGYAFRHALTRDAVDADMLPGERGSLHAAYGEALARQPAGGRRHATGRSPVTGVVCCLPAGPFAASWPGFAWWIRAWRWIGGSIVHRIRHVARIHHNLMRAAAARARQVLSRHTGTAGPGGAAGAGLGGAGWIRGSAGGACRGASRRRRGPPEAASLGPHWS